MDIHRGRSLFLGIILGLGILAAPSLGQANNNSTISGFVFGPDRRPIAQIWVELTNDVNRVVGRMRTDGSGRFFFTSLTNGRYSIKALPLGTGLLEHTEEVELSGIGSRRQSLSDNQQKDLYLKARKSAGAAPFQNSVVYAQVVPKEAKDVYKNAVDDIEGQRIQAGITGLERATEIFPTYFLALQKLGTMRLMQGEFEKSVKVFERALEVNSRCFDCWYGVGYSKYNLRKFPEAVAATEKALIESPESIEANLLLGMSCRVTKQLDKAESALKRAIKASDNTSADARWQLALLYGRDTARYAEAAQELEAYLKLVPEAPNKDEIRKLIKHFKDRP